MHKDSENNYLIHSNTGVFRAYHAPAQGRHQPWPGALGHVPQCGLYGDLPPLVQSGDAVGLQVESLRVTWENEPVVITQHCLEGQRECRPENS